MPAMAVPPRCQPHRPCPPAELAVARKCKGESPNWQSRTSRGHFANSPARGTLAAPKHFQTSTSRANPQALQVRSGWLPPRSLCYAFSWKPHVSKSV